MAERHHAGASRAPPGGMSKTSRNVGIGMGVPSASTAAAASSSSTSTSSVRRNLFQSQLTRRPTGGVASAASAASGSTRGSSETLRLDADLQLHPPGKSKSPSPEEDLDIVIRDKNGEISLGDPPTPLIEDADEVPALDARQEGERERMRLAEAVKQHQIEQGSVPAQPEELLEAVRASLRAKVAALADDNWMFEREELPRHQL